MLHPPHPPCFDQLNITWRVVSIMTLFAVEFLPTSCVFLALMRKYPPQHHILEHPQPLFLPSMWPTKFHTHTKQQAKSYFLYFHFCVFIYSTLWDLPHWTNAHPKQTSTCLWFSSCAYSEVLQNRLSETNILSYMYSSLNNKCTFYFKNTLKFTLKYT